MRLVPHSTGDLFTSLPKLHLDKNSTNHVHWKYCVSQSIQYYVLFWCSKPNYWINYANAVRGWYSTIVTFCSYFLAFWLNCDRKQVIYSTAVRAIQNMSLGFIFRDGVGRYFLFILFLSPVTIRVGGTAPKQLIRLPINFFNKINSRAGFCMVYIAHITIGTIVVQIQP